MCSVGPTGKVNNTAGDWCVMVHGTSLLGVAAVKEIAETVEGGTEQNRYQNNNKIRFNNKANSRQTLAVSDSTTYFFSVIIYTTLNFSSN